MGNLAVYADHKTHYVPVKFVNVELEVIWVLMYFSAYQEIICQEKRLVSKRLNIVNAIYWFIRVKNPIFFFLNFLMYRICHITRKPSYLSERRAYLSRVEYWS